MNEEHLKIIKNLIGLEPTYDSSWVGSNPSKAFLICLGAGPWKIERRKKVQERAIQWLDDRDLGSILPRQFQNIYPLEWQNTMLLNMINSLNRLQIQFSTLCNIWTEKSKNSWITPIEEFFNLCGSNPNGTKVLWLFVRDYMKLPAFPIDRHVRRKLKEFKLPCDPLYIIDLCQKVGIDPNKLNRALFAGKNPDFSKS